MNLGNPTQDERYLAAARLHGAMIERHRSGDFYAPWQLHRRASAVAPEMAGTMPIHLFARGQLVRQRDALKTVVLWYVLPFLPGIAVVLAANGYYPEIEAAGPPIWARWLVLLAIAAFVCFAWWLNWRGARRLQRRIDEIDALTGGEG